MSNLRRQRIKSVVAEKYRPLCNDSTPVTENFLGDDLEKQIKTLDEMRKVGMDLTKHRGEKRKHKSQDSYDRSAKYQKHNNYYSGNKKEKNSFLERKPGTITSRGLTKTRRITSRYRTVSTLSSK